MLVNIYKGRGAIVPDHTKVLVGYLVPLELVKNIEVYRFDCTFQGLPACKWAEFWLKKRDKRARVVGTAVPVPYTKPSGITARACYKSFLSSQKKSKKTKIKMVGNLTSSAIL